MSLMGYQERLENLKSNLTTAQAGILGNALESIEQAMRDLETLREGNKTIMQQSRIAYGHKGGMTQGGNEAMAAATQIVNILDNAKRALTAVYADVSRTSPLFGAQIEIAERTISFLNG